MTQDAPTVEWRDLSEKAQDVIEWLEDPHSGTLHTMTVRLGERPAFSGRVRSRTHAPVDEALFSEIVGWVCGRPGDFETVEIDRNRVEAKLAARATEPAPSLPRP